MNTERTEPCTIVEFPTGRPVTLRHVTILRLDAAETFMATAGFLPGDPGAPWAWIQETIAAEYECHESEVHVLETEEDGDLITAEGLPVARVAIGPYPRSRV